MRAYRDWIEDVIDVIGLEAGDGRIFSAPGNIGVGELYGLKAMFSTPLSPFISGGTFKADATFQDPSVTDPITGRERALRSSRAMSSPQNSAKTCSSAGSRGV